VFKPGFFLLFETLARGALFDGFDPIVPAAIRSSALVVPFPLSPRRSVRRHVESGAEGLEAADSEPGPKIAVLCRNPQ